MIGDFYIGKNGYSAGKGGARAATGIFGSTMWTTLARPYVVRRWEDRKLEASVNLMLSFARNSGLVAGGGQIGHLPLMGASVGISEAAGMGPSLVDAGPLPTPASWADDLLIR